MNKKIIEKRVLKKSIKSFLNKFLVTIIIFLLGMILVKNNEYLKQQIKENIYEKNIPFQKIKLLYEKYCGNILSIEKKEKEVAAVFHEKLSYEKKEKYQRGVKLTVSNHYVVPSLESGVVIYIGEKEELGKTIIIEQVDGINTLYANINTTVKLYDYIEKGETIGEVEEKTLYLFFQQKGEYLDYQKYL